MLIRLSQSLLAVGSKPQHSSSSVDKKYGVCPLQQLGVVHMCASDPQRNHLERQSVPTSEYESFYHLAQRFVSREDILGSIFSAAMEQY